MKKGIRTTKQVKGRKKHGFIARMSSHNGRQVLRRRRTEGRAHLTV